MLTVARHVMDFLAGKGLSQAFLFTGGMAMHLNDALASEDRIRTVCCHHEQACALAAEGYAHVTGRPALVLVTAGPGALNALTGVFGAYTDGVPMIVVSGQSKTETTAHLTALWEKCVKLASRKHKPFPWRVMLSSAL